MTGTFTTDAPHGLKDGDAVNERDARDAATRLVASSASALDVLDQLIEELSAPWYVRLWRRVRR